MGARCAQMNVPFRHRTEAGRTLAQSLSHLAGREDVLVLAVPHGGVPVAFEVARALDAPLDLAVVQPILYSRGPSSRDVTLGLLGAPAALQLHEATLNALDLSDEALGQALSRARRQLRQRVRAMRPAAPVPSLEGRTVVVVDDGTATGMTLRRAAGLLRRAGARSLVAAVPVGAEEALRLLANEFEEVVCCAQPEPFVSVSDGYDSYPDVTDAQVRELLARAWSGYAPRKKDRGEVGLRADIPSP
ncbi:phosphoribosyltransferase [Archangium violaceum]|nr:phosphoribosyltransferase [Archangium violaceum]